MNNTTPQLRTKPGQPDWRLWLAIVVLGIGAFTIVTTELAPIGLLSAIAADIGRTESAIGLTVTLYAWIGAISALAAAVALDRFPRKPLLIGLMLCLAASNGAVMVADSFNALLAARAGGAIAHGLFWAVIAACASQIAPARHVGLATSIVFGGVSAASVLGVPLATLIGQASSWHVAFGAAGALSLLTAFGMMIFLPAMAPAPAHNGADDGGKATGAALGTVLRRMDLWGIYAATAFAVTAHFAAFTYIEPFLRDGPNVQALMVTTLLFGFGVAGLAANFLTGVYIDRYLRPVLALSLAVMTLSLCALGAWGRQLGVAGVSVLLILWGASISAIFVGFQTWILRTAGAAVMPASALYVAIFNAAIGGGAMIGAWVLSYSGFGGVMMIGGLGGALSVLVVALLGSPAAVEQPALQP